MLSDNEIAQGASLMPISEITELLGIRSDEYEPYGHYVAKLNDRLLKRLSQRKPGKLVLVTATNPTPVGEGKTTTTIGLGQSMKKIGKRAVLALREPSMGPVFGAKGGAAGGGYAQVLPMQPINLHFTGDMHAITSANNLLCAVLDNHLQQGNGLGIDTKTILVKRCVDMNDRALRNIVIGLGGKAQGIPREDHFIITVATEVMAILCLSKDMADLKERLGNILVAYRFDGGPVYCKDLRVHGAMAALLKEAMKPNLVQTIEHTPAIMHGGPFANIAHGCNSIRATDLAMRLGDYCITEAGFGSDLGAEKFFDIKCRTMGISPDAVVLVTTARALKYNGGVSKENLNAKDVEAIERGLCNLEGHIEIIKKYRVPLIVAVNRFPDDTDEELSCIEDFCKQQSIECCVSEVYTKGGDGGVLLARKVCEACEKPKDFSPLYGEEETIKEKAYVIAREIYGARGVLYTKKAERAIEEIERLCGHRGLPVCIAKTQYSFSDNPGLRGRPADFDITVRDVQLSNGAGFIVMLTGDIMTMPGLPKRPAAEEIDIDEDGFISGLF